MATITETKTVNSPAVDAAALHNAQISERYLRLKNAVDEQFEEARAEAIAPRASTLTLERPTAAQPETVEYEGHTRVTSSLFTAETLDSPLQKTAPAAEVFTPAAPVFETEAAVEEEVKTYSLNKTAAKAIAGFFGVVTVMLTAIGVNTRIINTNDIKIAMLEQRNAAIAAEITDLQGQIAIAESEEVIAQFAQANGMVKAE